MRARASIIVRPPPEYLSPMSCIIMALILLLSVIGRPLFNLTRDLVGRSTISHVVWVLLGLGCVGGVHVVRRLGAQRLLPVTLLLLPGLFVALSLELPEERMHLLEFGALGFCLCWDSFRSFEGLRRNAPVIDLLRTLIIACTIGIVFACLDEGVQALLPERVADMRDIFLNSFSIFWGAALCLLAKSKS